MTKKVETQELEAAELERRCAGVRRRIDQFAAPWFVEFAGMPRAGKSSCISMVSTFLSRNDCKVLAPSEGASRVPDFMKRDLIAYNTWTATYAIRQLLEGMHYKGPRYHFVLLDRGLFDATVWFHVLEEKGKISEDERKSMTRFIRIPHWRSLIKQVFLFVCSPEESRRRERKKELTAQQGGAGAFLSDLHRVYTGDALECYKEDFPIVTVNTEATDKKATALRLCTHSGY